MNRLTFAQASMIIESIYESEIPCRIEWVYDGGFVWSIQNDEYPRLWKDEQIDQKILCETPENMLLRNNPFLEKDWTARGGSYSFLDTIMELADKVVELYPHSKLAEWYVMSNRKYE